MDIKQATKSVIDKIHKLEPEIETACKIIGCVLMQDLGEQGMIRLAIAPDKFLENLVHRTKIQLGYLSTKAIFPSISPPMATNPLSISEVPLSYIPFSSNGTNRPYSSPATLNPWDPHLTPEHLPGYGSEFGSFGYLDPVDNFFEYEDHFPQDLYHLDRGLGNLNMRTTCRSLNFSQKSCHYYFDRGYCRNGSKCQFFHGHENFSTIYGRSDPGNEDHGLAPGSLEKLEYEITELLKSKRGNPVSIASLHTSYYEKYGKILQADGYLTESQRHGRAGYNLTTLLERFKSIRVIERPHGQHFVILAEDASRFKLENRTERNDPGPIVSGSRQIYLTFPAESTFTEEDVSNYFSSFGTVEDVRIPCQQKRMFGFVTFTSANTVRTLLDNPNTHFVCGSRVLVKPYRERSKHNERKYTEKYDRGLRNEAPRFIRRQLMEEKEKLEAEMQRMRLSKLQLRFKHAYNQQYIDSSINQLSSSSKDPFKLRNGERFSCLLGLINNNSVNDNKLKHSGSDSNSNSTNQDSDEIDLPESPFSTAIRGDISASL